jgi:hypothetical protein
LTAGCACKVARRSLAKIPGFGSRKGIAFPQGAVAKPLKLLGL